MIRILSLLFLVINFICVNGQSEKNPIEINVNYQKFGKKDGLPSSKTSAVFEDSKGYIWIGTYNGISRYDGNSFYNFNDQDKKSTSQIQQIIELPDYKIVTRTMYGNVNIIFKNRVLKNFKNDYPKSYVSSVQNFNNQFFIIVRHSQSTPSTFLEFYDIKTFKKLRTTFLPFYTNIIKTKNEKILFSIFNENKLNQLRLYFIDGKFKFNLIQKQNLTQFTQVGWQSNIISEDGKWLFDFNILNNKIVQNKRPVNYSRADLDDFSLDKSYKKEGYFKKDKDNHLIFINNADKTYDLGDLAKLHKEIYIDSHKRFWVCAESALYLFPSIETQSVTLNLSKNGNDEIWSMARKGDEYYFSSYVFGLHKTDVNLTSRTKIQTQGLFPANNIAVFGAKLTKKQGLFLPHMQSILYIDPKNKKHLIKTEKQSDIYATIINRKNGDLYFSNYHSILRLDEKTLTAEKIFSLPFEEMKNILDIDFDSDGNLLAIGSSGLLIQNKNKWKKINGEDAIGYSLASDDFGSVWIGGKKGLGEMKNDQKIAKIDFGFPISNISDLYVYKKKWLLIGTKDELIIFNLEEYHKNKKIKFFRYDYISFFCNDEGGQNNFFEDVDGAIWWPMNGKLVKFYPEKLLQKYSQSCPTIFGILANVDNKFAQLEMPPSNTSIKIDKNHREISFQFGTPLNLNRDIVKYRTRLLGFKNNWENIQNLNEITYRNLSPGKFQFEIQASIDNKNWSSSTKSNPIIIGSYFYETLWFKILMGIFFLLLFFYFIKNYFQDKQKKLETQNSLLSLQFDLNKMELQSLNKQLDPHEIKNLLASISPEIQEKAPESYRKMLKLLNITKASLNNSSMTESVKNQVQQIEDFLSLEKNSLSVPFQYSIENKIETKNAQIPRLMLKNLVENAIKHGIKRSEKGGEVNVILTEENQFFKIIVDDTGKGRKLDTISDTGIGTSTYRNLFATLNKKNAEAATFEIIDKKQGTRVEVKIPIIYKYE